MRGRLRKLELATGENRRVHMPGAAPAMDFESQPIGGAAMDKSNTSLPRDDTFIRGVEPSFINSEEQTPEIDEPEFTEMTAIWPHADPLAGASASRSARPNRQLSSAAAVSAPRTTLSLSVDGTIGISELVFGAEGSASRVAFQHDVGTSAFALVRNSSTILEVGSAGEIQLGAGSASSVRIFGGQLSFENRNVVTVTELDGVRPVWDRSNLQIYRGDTVVWVWTSVQNVAQADANFAAINTRPGSFYSGVPILTGNFSLRFDKAGTYYYKSQNTASMTGTITVKEFGWSSTQGDDGNRTGNLAVGGNVVIDGNLLVAGNVTLSGLSWVNNDASSQLVRSGVEYPSEVKGFPGTSSSSCPSGWTYRGYTYMDSCNYYGNCYVTWCTRS